MTAVDNWRETVQQLGKGFAARAAQHDEDDSFVGDNYAELKAAKLFSAMVPAELGGGGLPHGEMCALIREVAQYCSSTALAFSMHQHLVAAAVWNYRRGNPGEKLLRRVADGETVLVSTGANDWLSSSGNLEPCEGGFRYTGTKAFASGCPAGDLLITSGRYNDPEKGLQVLHFPVSMRAEGVRIEQNWKAMGMRGTGSNSVALDKVFIAGEAITVRRPAGEYHNLWNVVLTVAMPLVMAAYLGTAEAAARLARQAAAKRGGDDLTAIEVGEMENHLTTGVLAFESMVGITNNFDFEPSVQKSSDILIRKTIVAESAIRTASKALEIAGGTAYFRSKGLEKLLRDVFAGQFHPLPATRQHRFTGRVLLGLKVDPGEEKTERAAA